MATTFSSGDAAMEGFQVVKRHPQAVLVWAAVVAAFNLLFYAAAGAVLSAVWSPDIASLGLAPNPSMTLGLANKVRMFQLGLSPFGIVFMSVLSAAVFRAVLKPEDRASFYLRFGPDEWRQILLRVVMSLLAIFVVVLVTLAVILCLAIGWAASGMPRDFAHSGAWIIWFLVFGLLIIAISIVLAVRFSLAGVMTFAEGRLRLFESWDLTRGAFWPLLGAYFLASILSMLVAMGTIFVTVLLGGMVFLVSGGFGLFAHGFSPSVFWSLAPTVIVAAVPLSIGAAIQYTVMYAVAAFCYRELTAPIDRPNPLHVIEGAGPPPAVDPAP